MLCVCVVCCDCFFEDCFVLLLLVVSCLLFIAWDCLFATMIYTCMRLSVVFGLLVACCLFRYLFWLFAVFLFCLLFACFLCCCFCALIICYLGLWVVFDC